MERGVEEEEEDEEEATLTPNQLLQLAETHLRLRNFSLCRQYALESQQPDDPHRHSNNRCAAQLAAVADIHLAATAAPGLINWYSILQVDTFSDDHNLIRSQFKKLLLLLDPIKDKFALAKEALTLVHEGHSSLMNPAKKAQLDSQLSLFLSNQKYVNGDGQGGGEGSFWTFCPYCFYVYQYAKVYEGCCLRCQNETCRRPFHGVALCSLPRMNLEKGQYFSCFGYFPLGLSPSECEGKGKFASWSPIVGLFPVRRIGKTCAGRMDFDDDDDIVEILDESDESESPAYDNENAGTNMEVLNDGHHAAQPRTMKRKSVAWNAKKLMSKRKWSNEGTNSSGVRSDFDGGGNGDDNDDETYDVENMPADVDGRSGYDLQTDDMKFFEEGGEIFVGLGPDPDDAF